MPTATAFHSPRTRSFHPGTCPARVQYLRPCSDLCNVPGPGIFPLTGYLPFHLSRRPRPEYLLFPTLALLVRLSWDTCNPTQFPAQARLPPAANLSPGPCRAARLLRGLSPERRHSPWIPSLRKDSVSFPGARATNLGATGGVASRRANLSLANDYRRTPLHRPGLWAIGWVT